MVRIYPSLISSDLLNLAKTVHSLDPYCAGYHLDIMDNHFVPNLTWGPQFANALAHATKKQLWVHLMVDDSESIIQKLTIPQGSIISFHIETKNHIAPIIESILSKKWLPSIAISPKTDVTRIIPFLDSLYQVLVMSVEPGWSGQAFIPSTITTLDILATYRHKHTAGYTLAMDGGISEHTIPSLIQKGVTEFALASAIFDYPDPVQRLKEISETILEQ